MSHISYHNKFIQLIVGAIFYYKRSLAENNINVVTVAASSCIFNVFVLFLSNRPENVKTISRPIFKIVLFWLPDQIHCGKVLADFQEPLIT